MPPDVCFEIDIDTSGSYSEVPNAKSCHLKKGLGNTTFVYIFENLSHIQNNTFNEHNLNL